MTAALAGLTVLDLCEDVPGAACGRQFAAWGARVVAVEHPGGSPLRRAAPLAPGRAGERRSLLWEYLAAGKESAVCDLEVGHGRERFDALLRGADVVITDRRPAGREMDALDARSLTERAPVAVVVSVTPFGLDGPYAELAGSDLVVQALAGFLSLNGLSEREPLKAAANVLPIARGVAAFAGALAALRARDRTGRGGLVEAAGIETVASIVKLLATEYSGERHVRAGTIGAMFLPCRDGFITANPTMDRVWDDLLIALGVEHAELPEALRTEDGRKDLALVERFLGERTRERDAEDLFAFVAGLQVVSGLFRTPRQLLDNPQLAARGFFHRVNHPSLGDLRFPGPPARLSETPMVEPRPAPELESGSALTPRPPLPPARERGRPWQSGSDRIPLSRAGGRGVASEASRGEGRAADQFRPPLADIRVLDLTHAWIGPYATLLLADLGADVVKVESGRRPDVWRRLAGGPRPRAARPEAHPLNVSNLFNSVNRDKRSVDLDLATERGRALFLRLVESADLVVENFTPRVLDNLGLGWERLRAVKPDLILVSFSGYGANGPYRDYKANGGTTETIAGWVSLFGYPDAGPITMGTMQADAITGLQMAATALVALHHRDRTGEGQRIDGAMFDAAAGYIGEELLLAHLTDEPARPLGNHDRDMAPHGTYRCRNDEVRVMSDESTVRDRVHHSSLLPHHSDQWVAIAVRDDATWERLAAALDDVPALRDPRFATLDGRQEHDRELDELLGEWTLGRTADEATARLRAAGVSAAAVRHTDEVLDDPHLTARGWFRPRSHPDLGIHRYNGPPVRIAGTPSMHHRPPPLLGEHSEEILMGELGLTAAEYEALVADSITGTLRERVIEDATAAN